MFATFKTLMAGANARAEEQVRDRFCVELIDQKIREADASLKSAKLSLAGLIQRERSESRQVAALEARVGDLVARATEALSAGREDLASEAANAIAHMENELEVRRATVMRLETRILQLRQSVETANRRLIDLKQGAIAARAAKREQDMQRRLRPTIQRQDSAFEEAEALIQRALNRDDPFEQGEILRDIDAGLDNAQAADRLAEAGFGAPLKSSGAAVLARLKAQSAS